MRAKSVLGIAAEELRSVWPKRVIGLMVITFLIIALFGLAFEKGPTEDVPVIIVNLDPSPDADSVPLAIMNELGQRDIVDVVEVYDGAAGSLDAALRDLKEGNVKAVLLFGPNFTRDVGAWTSSLGSGSAQAPTELVLYLDGTNPSIPGAVKGEVQRAVQTVLATNLHFDLPVRLSPQVIYAADADMLDFIAPGIVSLLLFITTLMPALATAGADYSGPRAGGGTHGERFFGQALSALAVGIVQVSVVLPTFLLFPVSMEGDMLMLFLLLTALVLASAGFGALLAAVIRKNPSGGMALLPLLIFPAILLSGLIIPLSSIPAYLLPISFLFPVTYSIEGARLIMLGGMGAAEVWTQLSALVAYSMTAYLLAWYLSVRLERHTAGDSVTKASKEKN